MSSPYLTIHRLLRRLQQKNRFVGRVEHTGLSPAETHFLLELEADTSRSISDLSDLLGVDQSFGSRLAQGLVKKKLIHASRTKEDARRRSLTVTAQGRAMIRLIDSVADRLIEGFAAPLSKSDRQTLVTLIRLIADGYGHPAGIRRPTESEYRVEQRRVTRCFGMLGEHVFESPLSSSSWQLLAEVSLSPVAPQPTELAGLLALAQNSLSSIIKVMEKARLIRRVQREGDKRSVTIEALAAGIELHREIENRAASQLKNALRSVSAAEVEEYVEILGAFVGERDGVVPPLAAPFEAVKLLTAEDRAEARAFAARELVAQGQENLIPEEFVGARSSSFAMKDAGRIVALAEVKSAHDRPGVVFAAWSADVSPWHLLGFVGRVQRETSPQRESFSPAFIRFPPLRKFFDFA